MEQITNDVTENNGFIKINDVQIGNIEHFELTMSQTPPPVYNPSIDLEVTEAIRSFELAVSRLSQKGSGKLCLVFNKANVHQASVLHPKTEFKFELQRGFAEIATGTACIGSIQYSHDLIRNVTFKVIGEVIITRKNGA